MARAARGVLPSESVVLISISSRKMSRASRRSASDRPDWVAPTRGSRASVSAAHATRATKRITSRMASIYRIGPEAERAQDGAEAGPLTDRTDVVVGVERQADVIRAGGRREPLLLGAPLEAPQRAPVQDPDGARAGRGSPRRRARALPDPRDRVDLNPYRLGKRGRLHGGARGLVRREVLGVHLVHGGKVGHVDEVHRRLHDEVQARACALQHRREIPERLLSLLGGVLADDVAGPGIERDLARRVHHPVHHDGLAVGTDRLGRALGRDDAQSSRLHQNSPSMVPSGCTRIFSAAGVFESPGMVMMSPASGTTNPAPADGRMSRTWSVKPLGAPSFAGSSLKEYCVFAMHTGVSDRKSTR